MSTLVFRIAIVSVFLMGATSLFAQIKANKPIEGKIHVSLNVISIRDSQPFGQPIVVTFYGNMLIEPLYFIDVKGQPGNQKKEYLNSGYYLIDMTSATFRRIEKLSCNLKTLDSGSVAKKPEGLMLARDLFKGVENVLRLSDTSVDGVKYMRYQANTIDPATKKNIRAIAYAASRSSKLPISLSKTLEDKYHCAISYIDVFYKDFDGIMRMVYEYERYKLTDSEKQVLKCYK